MRRVGRADGEAAAFKPGPCWRSRRRDGDAPPVNAGAMLGKPAWRRGSLCQRRGGDRDTRRPVKSWWFWGSKPYSQLRPQCAVPFTSLQPLSMQLCWTNQEARAESQWIVAQGLLSHLQYPDYSKSSTSDSLPTPRSFNTTCVRRPTIRFTFRTIDGE